MAKTFYIDPDIRKAETLPSAFYQDPVVFTALKEKVFARSWQWLGDQSLVPLSNMVFPFSLLDDYLEEPMILVRDQQDSIRCLSNICTHRGNIIMHHPGKFRDLSCQYHGRRFGMDGSFKSMPEFKEAENFPRPCDHLHEFQLKSWGPFLFTSLEPSFKIESILHPIQERIGFLPLEQFKLEKSLCKDYLVNAHWALYCDNYLEGFHIPFVHNDLNAVLDYETYKTELFEYSNLQIGYAKDGEEAFDLPPGHMDYGQQVAAYYYWIFPNMMFNFYPWGLSLNVVKPIQQNKTKVSFLTYVYDEKKLDSGAGALLDKVEREDEFVVEAVHKGLKSRFYKTGRFSPTREQGVHHFHQLLADFYSK